MSDIHIRKHELLEAALDYLARGWSVIPVRPGDKRPLIEWQDYQQRLPGADEVRHWFARWPDTNLGIVTGAVSRLVVLDVDPAHDGVTGLNTLQKRHGALPETVEAVSGGGGRHLYFRHPGRPVRNRVALAPGVDLRGDGGMIVVPPSLHPSGRRYVWRVGHSPQEINLAPLPEWLFEEQIRKGSHAGHPIRYWRKLLAEGVSEGTRNNTIASLSGHLLWHGVDPKIVTELLLCWNRIRCRPPLPDAEVVRTVQSIVRLHEREEKADHPS